MKIGLGLLGTLLLAAGSAAADESLRGLVRRLGDARWEVREDAEFRLLAAGPAARGWVSEAALGADPEVAERAGRILPFLPWSDVATDRVAAALGVSRVDLLESLAGDGDAFVSAFERLDGREVGPAPGAGLVARVLDVGPPGIQPRLLHALHRTSWRFAGEDRAVLEQALARALDPAEEGIVRALARLLLDQWRTGEAEAAGRFDRDRADLLLVRLLRSRLFYGSGLPSEIEDLESMGPGIAAWALYRLWRIDLDERPATPLAEILILLLTRLDVRFLGRPQPGGSLEEVRRVWFEWYASGRGAADPGRPGSRPGLSRGWAFD